MQSGATGDFSKPSNRVVHGSGHPTRIGADLFVSLQISRFRFSRHSTGVGVRKPAVLSHKVHERSKKGIVHGTRWVLKLHALKSHIMFLAFGMKFNRNKRTRAIEHLAIFVFKYLGEFYINCCHRSSINNSCCPPAYALQADGIAPKDTV